MNQYTLDYTAQSAGLGSPARPPESSRKRPYRQPLLLISGLMCSVAAITSFYAHTEANHYRRQYQLQAVQYDSLLMAKIEIEQQLNHLKNTVQHP